MDSDLPLPPRARFAVVLCLLAATACRRSGSLAPANTAVTAATHVRFPIVSGPHAVSCDTCHGDFPSFAQFNCLGCHAHEQGVTDQLHRSQVAASGGMLSDGGVGYAYASQSCLACHMKGERVPFDHAGVTATCASCHGSGAPFVALPVNGVGLDGGAFVHPDMRGNDCRACHTTTSWSGAGGAPDNRSDPAHDLVVTALIPSYVDTSIASLTAQDETLPMPMNHQSAALPTAALSSCANCHASANQGIYFPGTLHASLTSLGLAQPALCLDCHASSVPAGFVGPPATSPPRTPSSGEMKHDAVLWSNGAPGRTAAVTQECSVCHLSPTPAAPGWTTALKLHASLDAAAQPASCLDCHANSRPVVPLTSANAALPANVTFDHGASAALGDCATCHGGGATPFTAWSGGRFHLAGSATPATCLPCHEGERPTSTATWASATWQSSPFDYVPNASGITHGDGQDCVACHTGAGTGAWGGTQNWQGGHFAHGPAAISRTTCIACHMTQRPDLAAPGSVLPNGFDHSRNGTGDCFGCHQATVTANTYVHYFNPATGALPGGDWQGGVEYPGATLVSAPTQFITVAETMLNRSGANNLVTSTSTISATLYNGMLHTSTAVPKAMGLGTTPDYTQCWHCHTHDSTGSVTSYSNGQYHPALASYSATVGGAVTPLPQPTSQCSDCHGQMRPSGIVSKGTLQPMDHAALAAQVDCSSCHQTVAGTTWADGVFHANIGAAAPQDCTVCHYPLMADAPSADVTGAASAGVPNTALFAMRHRSSQITFQNCQSCHASTQPLGTPLAASLWRPGGYHPSLAAQPVACADCHAVSEPAANASTQSSVSYAFAAGGTQTNGAQWMNHGASVVVGKDCFGCHAADARPSGSAWSKGDSVHSAVASFGTCRECHGLTNGGGTVPGTNNNLPSGLTSSSTLTAASADSSTGIPAGTLDQITHADVNASAHDCNFCHAQAGPSTAPGVQGREWAQASFHTSFTAASPLVMNGTTGRCSSCHMNVKPGPSYTSQDHSGFSATPGTQDCASCHSWPGSGTASSPNWLGASAAPQFITVGGFTVPQPPAGAPAIQPGIANLPHPATAGVSCTACHASASGGKQALGYDHASTLINTNCNSCHEAGSDLVGTAWNGVTVESSGNGDTRPFTLTSVYAAYSGNSSTVTYPNHFYDSGTASAPRIVDCNECHVAPAGIATATSGATYLKIGTGGRASTGAWMFPHNTSKMADPTTCAMCHGSNIPR